MVKNIIFDLDNTIITNTKEDVLKYKEALTKCGYDENDFLAIYDALDDYADSLNESNRFFSKQDAIDFLNKSLSKNYDLGLMDEINDVIGKYWTQPLLQESILEYLHSKYALYVFTNWFESAQAKRLESMQYLKYFKGVFGADNFGMKPYSASFYDVLSFIGASPSECIMIGDSKPHDILGANNVGMHAILFDYNGKRDLADVYAPDYTVIKNLNELENIL